MTFPIEPSVPALREVLWATLADLRAKTIGAPEANAAANLGGKVHNTYKLQLAILQLANRQPEGAFLDQLGLPSPQDKPEAK